MGMMLEDDYCDLLNYVLKQGSNRTAGRNGSRFRSLFAPGPLTYDAAYANLLHGKKVNFKGVVAETLWYLQGRNDVKWLEDRGCAYLWKPWELTDGTIGKTYGYEYGKQLSRLLEGLQSDPEGRRHIINLWNPDNLDEMALTPCCMLLQFFVRGPRMSGGKRHLDMMIYQRSADLFIGVPHNIAQFSLMNRLIAREVGLRPGIITHNFGDAHIYHDHYEGVDRYFDQWKSVPFVQEPEVIINEEKPLAELDVEDIIVRGYKPQPFIKVNVSV